MGNPTVHLHGTLENIVTPAPGVAAKVADAKVRIELSNYGPYIPAETGTTRGTLAKGEDYAAMSSPGVFDAYLFRNDQIYPIGTFYTVIVEDADGNVIQCGAYRFNTDGDFDLATQTPIDAQSPPPPLPPTPPYSELLIVPDASAHFDGSVYTAFQCTLTQDVTWAWLSGFIPGNLYTFTIIQDAVGGHIFQWPSGPAPFGLFNAGEVCSAPNSRTTQTFVADENGVLYAISVATWLL